MKENNSEEMKNTKNQKQPKTVNKTAKADKSVKIETKAEETKKKTPKKTADKEKNVKEKNVAAGMEETVSAPEIGISFLQSVLFVASEANPFAGTGGLADVIGSLLRQTENTISALRFRCMRTSIRLSARISSSKGISTFPSRGETSIADFSAINTKGSPSISSTTNIISRERGFTAFSTTASGLPSSREPFSR